MRKFTVYSLPLLAMSLALPAAAQDDMTQPAAPAMEAPSPEMQAQTVSTWPPELQAQYETWPEDHKAFFWALPTGRQDIFWRIAPDDRSRLIALAAEEQEVIWTGMEAQIAAEGQPDAVPSDDPMTQPPTEEPVEEPLPGPDSSYEPAQEPMQEPMQEDDLTQPR